MPADAKTSSPLYIIHPWVDFLSTGGLSLLGFAILYFCRSESTNQSVYTLSVTLLWFCNWPHFSATLHRLYSSRENARQYPLTTYVLPFLVLGFSYAALVSPARIAPCFIKTYTLWAPFHFSGQSVGISLLYTRRAGIRLNALERRVLSFFIFSTFLYMVGIGESKVWTQTFVGLNYSSLELPQWIGTLGAIWFACCTLVFAGCFLRPKKLDKLPLIFFVPPIAQFFWFVLGPSFINFNQLVPFFHSLQYLPIILLMYVIEHQADNSPSPLRLALRFFRSNFIGGAFLFWACPVLLAFFGFKYELTKPVVFAAVNLHHFIIDGVIWKLRNSRVSSPLLRTLTFKSNPAPITWTDSAFN